MKAPQPLPARVERASTGARRALLPAVLLAALAPALSGCFPLAVGSAATGAAVAYDPRTAGTIVDDKTIELKSLEAIETNKTLREQTHINVTSYNLVVLVTGEAPTEALRADVIEKIRRVPRVKLVHDEVAIAAPSSMTSRASDSYITAKVKTELFTLKDFDAMDVKVVTERGVVYLMGLLDREEGDRAANRARAVGGVQKVVKLFEYPG